MDLLLLKEITPSLADNAIQRIQATKDDIIDVYINSPGGSVFGGYAIRNALRSSGKQINVKVISMAGSIASFIMTAATNKPKIIDPSRVMIHLPMGDGKGTAEQLEAKAKVLRTIEKDLVNAYHELTKLPKGKIMEMMKAQTMMTAQQAQDLGFAEIEQEQLKAVAKFDLNDMNLLEKLQSLAQFQKEEKPENEVTNEIEAKVEAELEAKKTSEDPAELLMQDYTAQKDFSEFKNSSEAFMDAMIEYVKSSPTKEEIEKSIKEITNTMFLEFVAKIKSEGKVPTKTETEANIVNKQTGNAFWEEIENGIKEIQIK